MHSPTDEPARNHPSARPLGRLPRALSVAGLSGLLLLAVWVSVERPLVQLENVFTEKWYFLEKAQLVAWLALIASTVAAAARVRARQGLLLALWLGVAGSLAVARELDLHAVLNPPNIHIIGLKPEQAVHFRIDWWDDPSVSLLLKLGWGGVFLAIGAALLAPFIAARYRWVRRIWRKEPFPCLIAGGLMMLFLGYISDDVIGRALRESGIRLSGVEEVFELMGVVLLATAAGVLAIYRGPDRPSGATSGDSVSG